MSGCATPGCAREPVWPSVRRSLTWCQECLADLCGAVGYEPAAALTAPKDRWLIRHRTCGRVRHSNLATVRKAVPVCPHCRWTEWAATTRAAVLPAYQRAISSAFAAGDQGALSEYVSAYLNAYVWPADRVRDVFASAGAELLQEPLDGDGLDPVAWRCNTCGYVDAQPPERMALELKASWMACHACDQQRLHHAPAVIDAYFRARHLVLDAPGGDGRGQVHPAHCQRCGQARLVSVVALAGGAPPCLSCDGRRLDPNAEHRVYLFEFPQLHVYKVGITHTADDNRLSAHHRAGGTLMDIITVPNRSVAFLVERLVLDAFRTYPAEVTASLFPQGGHTECWSVLAGRPQLVEVYKGVAARFAAL